MGGNLPLQSMDFHSHHHPHAPLPPAQPPVQPCPPPLHIEEAEFIQQIEEEELTCGGPQSSCCTVDPEDELPTICNCEAVEVPEVPSSERSSSYNSCTLPLKPLKGILKKTSVNLTNPQQHQELMEQQKQQQLLLQQQHQHAMTLP